MMIFVGKLAKKVKEIKGSQRGQKQSAAYNRQIVVYPNRQQRKNKQVSNTTATKVFETKDAIEKGADEIDMVINVGHLKDGMHDEIREEIRAIKAACGEHILKVIIETCLLTEEEKITMCHLVTEAGADYIKTSTGFSKAGATFEDVALMRTNVGKNVLVKAAGGISGIEDAEKFIELGASRLGTSRVVKAVQGLEGAGY